MAEDFPGDDEPAPAVEKWDVTLEPLPSTTPRSPFDFEANEDPTPVSPSRPQQAESESKNALIVGLVGAGMLAVGVFTPVVSAPLVGSLHLFQNGLSIGGVVLALAVVSSILAFTRLFRGLWLTGLGTLGLLTYSLTHFFVGITHARAAMQKAGADEPDEPFAKLGEAMFAKLGEAMMDTVQIQWGWAFLFIGALAVVASAAFAELRHQRKKELVTWLTISLVATTILCTAGASWGVFALKESSQADSKKQPLDTKKNPSDAKKKPREWYRAEWVKHWPRELDFDFGNNKRDKLRVTLIIKTEPDLPLKELHGHLAFVKDGKIIYETQLAEKPNVSFVGAHAVILSIPYDDKNQTHRTLRFAKDNELTPVFTVSKVVLADGKLKTFDKLP